MENRIPLKPVPVGMRIVVLMNRLNKSESAVFNIVGSLYF